MPNHSNVTAATGRDGVFHRGPTSMSTPTVYDSVSWVVDVSKGYQSVHIYIYMSAPTMNYRSVMICSIRKVHRPRKQLHCAIHGIAREVRIHRLRRGSHRFTDCARH